MLNLLLIALLLAALAPASHAAADEAAAWRALKAGAVLLLRHTTAPGVGDPPGMRIEDCATQRNLDDAGRAEAKAIGVRLRKEGLAIGAVWTSAWCRTRETAALAFPEMAARNEPAFNSFYGDQSRRDEQTRAARALIAQWKGPGALIVSTHQFNITALTGRGLAQGAGIVVAPRGDGFEVVGDLRF